jgi:hypothetical protein
MEVWKFRIPRCIGMSGWDLDFGRSSLIPGTHKGMSVVGLFLRDWRNGF